MALTHISKTRTRKRHQEFIEAENLPSKERKRATSVTRRKGVDRDKQAIPL